MNISRTGLERRDIRKDEADVTSVIKEFDVCKDI